MEDTEYRIYHFGNMYMSTIQQGIQAAHAQTELAIKMARAKSEDYHDKNWKTWYTWATEHKTMICLNAGYDCKMQEIKEVFESDENYYPWSCFNESPAAMGGMLTNVCIILPEEIYSLAARVRSKEVRIYFVGGEYEVLDVDEPYIISEFQFNLINILNQCGLAR